MPRKSNLKQALVITLIVGCAQLSATGLSAQGLPPVPDSALAHKITPTLDYSTKQPSAAYSDLMKSVGSIPHQLNLTKGFGIQTGGILSPTAMNGLRNANTLDAMSISNLRRPDLGLKGVRFDMQNFTMGASCNGLNNLTRGGGFSGEGGQGSRNTGLSIHAGLRF
jgi:hypothetical protein